LPVTRDAPARTGVPHSHVHSLVHGRWFTNPLGRSPAHTTTKSFYGVRQDATLAPYRHMRVSIWDSLHGSASGARWLVQSDLSHSVHVDSIMMSMSWPFKSIMSA